MPHEEPPVVAELRALVARAKKGDASVLPQIRQLLDEHEEITRHVADLEAVVVRAWAVLLAGDDPLSLEAVRERAELLRRDLSGDAPTPLECLLVGQVVACWLELSHAPGAAARAGQKSLGPAGFELKRAESAQKRYLAAIRTLTTVRALLPNGLVPASGPRLFAPDRGKKLA